MNTRAASSYKGPMFVNEAISNREAINKRAASSYNEAMFVNGAISDLEAMNTRAASSYNGAMFVNEVISDSVALHQNSGIHIISKPSYEIMKNRGKNTFVNLKFQILIRILQINGTSRLKIQN